MVLRVVKPGMSLALQLKAMRPYDRMEVQAGTYEGEVTLTAHHTQVTFKPGAKVRADSDDDFVFRVGPTAHHVKVSGGEFYGAGEGAGVMVDRTYEVDVDGVYAHHNRKAGVYFREVSEVSLTRSTITDNLTAGASVHMGKNYGNEDDFSYDIEVLNNVFRRNGAGNPDAPTERWNAVMIDGKPHGPVDLDTVWRTVYDGQTLVKGNKSYESNATGADYVVYYASEVDLIDNVADFKGGAYWLAYSRDLFADYLRGGSVKIVDTTGIWGEHNTAGPLAVSANYIEWEHIL